MLGQRRLRHKITVLHDLDGHGWCEEGSCSLLLVGEKTAVDCLWFFVGKGCRMLTATVGPHR